MLSLSRDSPPAGAAMSAEYPRRDAGSAETEDVDEALRVVATVKGASTSTL